MEESAQALGNVALYVNRTGRFQEIAVSLT